MPESIYRHSCRKCGTVKERQEMVLDVHDEEYCLRCTLSINDLHPSMLPQARCEECRIRVLDPNWLTYSNNVLVCYPCYRDQRENEAYECEGCDECNYEDQSDDGWWSPDEDNLDDTTDGGWMCGTCNTVALHFDLETEEFVCDHQAERIKLAGGVINDDPIINEIMLHMHQLMLGVAA